MFRSITARTLILIVTACTTVRPVLPPHEKYIRAHRPARVWITHRNGSLIVLDDPRLEGDTVTGMTGAAYREVLLADVVQLEAARPAPAKTAAAITAGLGLAAEFIYLLSLLFRIADNPSP